MPQQRYNRLFPPAVSSATVIRIYVLDLLANDQDVWGQKITNTVRDRFSGEHDQYGWRPPTGQVYRVLSELTEAGLIRDEWDDPDKRTRRMYFITDAGRHEIEVSKEENQELMRSALRTIATICRDFYGDDFVRWALGGFLR